MRRLISVKEEVRKLRTKGFSLGQIFSQTGIPKTTIRSWIKDITLSQQQKMVIKESALQALQSGRSKVQQLQREERLEKKNSLLEEGKKEIGTLTDRELFLTGVALYWGEGFKNKYEHRLGFCNSDPTMIKFYLYWLERCLKVKREDIILRLSLNKVYEKKADDIQNYWEKYLDCNKSQFTKTFYQTSVWKKQYKTDTYKGVLRVHVKNSQAYLLKMRGWIEGMRIYMAG